MEAFGAISCVPVRDVRFCEGGIDAPVASFDGVPLDVNVTLPQASPPKRGYPLVLVLHGSRVT